MTESPHLTDEQLASARKLLETVRSELEKVANGDLKVLFHARRYLRKTIRSQTQVRVE